MFSCAPTDSKIQDLDDITKVWMYYHWMEDKLEESTLLKHQACLIGSFWNAEAARKMLEDKEKISISDEDFDKSTIYMLENNKKLNNRKYKRNKRKSKKIIFNKRLDG